LKRSLVVCVFARPPGPVNVIRALTVTLPFAFSLLFAALVRASFTVIVGGFPDACDAFSSRGFFILFFDGEALRGEGAPATETSPGAWTLTISRLPWSVNVKSLVARLKISAKD
jgi:hypothetical protein